MALTQTDRDWEGKEGKREDERDGKGQEGRAGKGEEIEPGGEEEGQGTRE